MFHAYLFTPGTRTYDCNDPANSQTLDPGCITPLRIRAAITEASSDRPAVRIPSPTVEEWFILERETIVYANATFADAGVTVSFDRTMPDERGRVTFQVSVSNDVPDTAEVGRIHYRRRHSTAYEVRVGVELAGLQLAGSADVPEGTTFSPASMTWEVGRLGPDQTLRVPVSLSSENVSRDQRCLTASVTNAVPPFELDARRRANDVAKAYLTKADPKEILSEGEITLWDFRHCVRSNESPCGARKELKLFAKARDDGGKLFDPDSLIVQVLDPAGRIVDMNANSIGASAGVATWQTARQDAVNLQKHDGLHIFLGRQGFNANIDDWSNLRTMVAVRDESGREAPGDVSLRFDSRTTTTFVIPTLAGATRTRSFSLSSEQTESDLFFEFETLVTFVFDFTWVAAHTDGNDYEARGRYTFHVGPIAELEVRDARQGSPLAGRDQSAYTIVARHNGPDDAPMVLVELSGVPEGSRHILEEDGYFGTYQVGLCTNGLCDARWTIGKLRLNHGIARGYRTEFPTLTLIAPSGAAAEPITASISQVGDYSVCINGIDDVAVTPFDQFTCEGAGHSWQSTNYFDYLEENNTAEIVALPGTGEGDPGTPQSVETIGTSAGTLVLWSEAEYLNLWPVVGYQVERTNTDGTTTAGDNIKGALFLDRSPGENPQYRVRALNEWGVGSLWSERTGAPDADPSVTVKPTQLTVARSGEAAGAGYTVVLGSPPEGKVSIGVSSGDASRATVDRSTLVFAEANWNVPQTVTVTWAGGSASSGSVAITHTVSGGGYADVTAESVTVTVRDMVLDVSRTALEMPENRGQDTYTIALSSAPASDVLVDISSADSGVATVSPARLVFTPANYATPQTVTVTGVDDRFLNAGGERVTRISHRISGGGLPAVTLAGPEVTVTDDDRVDGLLVLDTQSVEVRETDDPETAGTEDHKAEYMVRLASRPESAVTVTMTVQAPAGQEPMVTLQPATLTFTPSTWMDPQTVTVTAVDDDGRDDSNNERKTVIRLAARGGGFDGVTSEVDVVVKDDDATTGAVTVSGIPAGAGSDADTRISEYNGATRLTIELGRFFTRGEGVIPLCLDGDAQPGTHYEVALAGNPAGATLSGANTSRPIIGFTEVGARRVVVEFTGKVHGTSESGHQGFSHWAPGTIDFTVEVCGENDPSYSRSPDDIRERSDVSFTGDASHTVSVLDGVLKQEGERLILPLYLRAGIAGELAFGILQHHYGAATQALPSEYDHPRIVTAPTLQTPGTFSLSAKQGSRSGERRYDVVACEERPGELCQNNAVAAFAGRNDTITVTIIDPVPGAPLLDSFGQSQDGEVDFREISIVAGGDITEGGIASFTITANPAPSANADVVVAVTQSGDFGVSVGPRTVVLGPSGTATFTVTTTDDSVDESDGSITVALSPSADYTVSATQGAATVAVADNDPPSEVSACVSDVLLSTVRYYYDANRGNPPNYGENWKRVLIAFGDVEDPNLTAYTAAEARASEEVWAGWLPTRMALECIEGE